MTEQIFHRASMAGTLINARQLGLNSATVIDVGAADGTEELYTIFPDSTHLLIEPLEENIPYLDLIVNSLPSAEYVIAAAGKEVGEITLNVFPDLIGTSAYVEYRDSQQTSQPRTVPVITLDALCQERELTGPYLLKLDVQGAELDVLAGATEVLKQTEYIILETTLIPFSPEMPLMADVILFMKERGFVPYDIFNLGYRPLDIAMFQVDMVFVPESSWLRQNIAYGTPEQMTQQTEMFRQMRTNRDVQMKELLNTLDQWT
ncbi:MAG: hypothetical protein Kow00121_42940 [Elainellaceae cyanobacterium]